MEFSEKFCGTSHDEITLEVYKKSWVCIKRAKND
jgi:hypothetical protein